MNNIVKILLKKGLVTDLARIPHSLDLSSPSMANSINAALKPLETLSRIVNQPQTITTAKTAKQKTTVEQSTAQGIVDETTANNPQEGWSFTFKRNCLICFVCNNNNNGLLGFFAILQIE